MRLSGLIEADDPDFINGPKILFEWPTIAGRPVISDKEWVPWECECFFCVAPDDAVGASIVIHKVDATTGAHSDQELPIHFGTTLLGLTRIENTTFSGTEETRV